MSKDLRHERSALGEQGEHLLQKLNDYRKTNENDLTKDTNALFTERLSQLDVTSLSIDELEEIYQNCMDEVANKHVN